MPPLLVTPSKVMSFEAAPSAIVKVLVDPPKSSLVEIVAVLAEVLVVRFPPKTKVAVALWMVPSVMVRVPVRVSVLVLRSRTLPVPIVRLLIVLSESKMGSLVTSGIMALSVVLGK